jgi:DNA-binding transcriptional ArsR family regulator
MLRIHFTSDDLVRTRVAGVVDPLWEMVFSRLRLSEQGQGFVFEHWTRQVRQEAQVSEIRPALQIMSALSPPGPYFPDFLTPPEGALGLEPAIEAIRATPCGQLRNELRKLSRTSSLPPWTRALAEGDKRLLADLGDALADYHRVAIEPHTDTIQAAVEADRAHRSRMMLDQGVEGLLLSMRPLMQWQPPVLHVHYDFDRDLHLRGRGLRLVPSYFCQRVPVAVADPDLAPTLVYPINHDYAWKYELAGHRSSDRALVALLGSTRAAVLAAIDCGATTSELARRLGTSPSSISRHTAVLRNAGLITTHRQVLSVLHTMTPLGAALLKSNDNQRGFGV